MGDSAIVRARCLICRAVIGDRIPHCYVGVCGECIAAMPCWRCGEPVGGCWPYLLCEPCIDVVGPEDIAWLNDPANQPDKRTWEMTPLGKPQGRVA